MQLAADMFNKGFFCFFEGGAGGRGLMGLIVYNNELKEAFN